MFYQGHSSSRTAKIVQVGKASLLIRWSFSRRGKDQRGSLSAGVAISTRWYA